MNKVQPNQPVKFIVVELAVPADMPDERVDEKISEVLAANTAAPDGVILDWQCVSWSHRPVVTATEPFYDDAEIFQCQPITIDWR